LEKKIIELSARTNQPIPDKILNAPELTLGLELFYNAFLELTSCRSNGMGIGPISWLAMMEFCDRFEIYNDQREDFVYYVRQLDEVYLSWNNKELDKKVSDDP
jgi:hypothetical protein